MSQYPIHVQETILLADAVFVNMHFVGTNNTFVHKNMFLVYEAGS